MEILLIMWILVPALAGYIAHKKRRNPYLWALLSYFSLIALIVLLFIPKADTVKQCQE